MYSRSAHCSGYPGYYKFTVDSMYQMFYNSGFTRTLCGGKWGFEDEFGNSIPAFKDNFGTWRWNYAGFEDGNGNRIPFDNLASSRRRRLGCCPAGSFMSNPFDHFDVDTSCSACPSNALTLSANDDIACINNVCPEGWRFQDTVYGCQQCASGYYKTNRTCTVCDTCGAGTTETTACSLASNRVCTQHVCSCTNGNEATGEACTANGTNICSSCSGGYYKTGNTCTGCTPACGTGTRPTTACSSTSNRVCTQNVCSCPGGYPVTGETCAIHGYNICSSCSSGYYKTGDTCTACTTCGTGTRETTACSSASNRVCTCSSGYYKTGDTCTACTTCGTGTRETTACSLASNRVCTQNICSCTNGVEATGTACTTNGTNICSSCSSEFYKTGDTCTGCTTCGSGKRETTACESESNRVCTQNVCSCANGVIATGTECTTHSTNMCSSCSGGYYKTGSTCTGCTTCGTGKRETTACSSASNRVCTQNVCSCTNGVAATSTACTTHSTNICSSCSGGYYKTGNTCTGCTTCGTGKRETTACSSASNRVCTQNVCSCTNGVAATSTACTTHSTNICSSCSGGYYKTGNTCTGCVASNGMCSTCTTAVCTAISSCDANKFDTNGFAADGCEAGCSTVPNGICSTCTNTTASGCAAVICDANKFDTNNIVADGCEDGCMPVPNGKCNTCSDTTTCTAVICDVNKFDTNNIAVDGCEDGCAPVSDGICTACTTATECTAVSCTVNAVDSNGDPTDGCEFKIYVSPLPKTVVLFFPLLMFLLLMVSSVVSKRNKLKTNKLVFQQSIQQSKFLHSP